MTYPVDNNEKELALIFTYNYQNLLASIGTKDNPQRYARFQYDAQGLLIQEILCPDTKNAIVHRSYKYSSSGFFNWYYDYSLAQHLHHFAKNGYGDAESGNA